jgi:hypothetical protein
VVEKKANQLHKGITIFSDERATKATNETLKVMTGAFIEGCVNLHNSIGGSQKPTTKLLNH